MKIELKSKEVRYTYNLLALYRREKISEARKLRKANKNARIPIQRRDMIEKAMMMLKGKIH